MVDGKWLGGGEYRRDYGSYLPSIDVLERCPRVVPKGELHRIKGKRRPSDLSIPSSSTWEAAGRSDLCGNLLGLCSVWKRRSFLGDISFQVQTPWEVTHIGTCGTYGELCRKFGFGCYSLVQSLWIAHSLQLHKLPGSMQSWQLSHLTIL